MAVYSVGVFVRFVCASVFVCVVCACLSEWCGVCVCVCVSLRVVVCVCVRVCLHGLLAYIQQRGLPWLSLISAVFDDGDEKTLRRSSLCLKGARHFAESEASPAHASVPHSYTHPQLCFKKGNCP